MADRIPKSRLPLLARTSVGAADRVPAERESRRRAPANRASDQLEGSGGDRPSSDWRKILSRRVFVAACIFGAWTVAIEARLIYLQVLQHDELVSRAERQQMRTVTAPAKRGEIVDRRGNVLAYSVDADSIYAVPTEIANPDAAATAVCSALDECSDRDRQTMADRMKKQRAFAFMRRQVTPDEARRVAALDLDGIGFLKENRRYYPKKELAAHVLGYVGIDNTGLNGIESTYDRQVRGRPGTVLVHTDARHRAFSRVERPPTAGSGLELTIDEYLQHIAERELQAAVTANRAAGGTVVMMDPHTGEILAMANAPDFNPNAFGKTEATERRNRAIQDIYEPGSTFKMVTASAAIEEQIINPDDPIDVSAGMIRFGSRQIDDTHRYGVLSFTDVIVKSSNVGAIKVGLRLGAERLSAYVRRFGFGEKNSRDFPAESPGIVWDASRLTDSGLASISMGYQVGVTPLQMAAAASSIANGGQLFEPHIVRAVLHDNRRFEVPARVIRRTIKPETAEILTSIMEAVVERGTARAAQVRGYSIAGKTGTAAKLVGGRYSKSEYNASFIGFVPSRKPVLTIIVVIDSPHGNGYYGGAIAAPVFKNIAESALRYLGVPPSVNPEPPVLIVRHEAGGATPAPTPVAMSPRATMVSMGTDQMPDLLGLSAREALQVVTRLGLGAQVIGSGFVAAQEPAAGTPVDGITTCVLRLERSVSGGSATGASP